MTDFSADTRPQTKTTPIGQCVDNFDNDPDTFADDCDYNCVQHNDFGGDVWDHQAQFEYSKDFALLGDVEFCSPSQAMGMPDPAATMALLSAEASGILNAVQPPAPYVPVPRAPPFRGTMLLCSFVWNGATQADIDACHEDKDDCPAAILVSDRRDPRDPVREGCVASGAHGASAFGGNFLGRRHAAA